MAQRRASQSKKNLLTSDDKAKVFMQNINDSIDGEQIDCGICFIKHADDTISAITTSGDEAQIMGTIEVGKNLFYQDGYPNDD